MKKQVYAIAKRFWRWVVAVLLLNHSRHSEAASPASMPYCVTAA
jgi:hypothetical protein